MLSGCETVKMYMRMEDGKTGGFSYPKWYIIDEDEESMSGFMIVVEVFRFIYIL